MDDQRYIRLYSIKGGIERLIDRLASEVSAEVRLNSRVVRIGRTPRGTYRITSRREYRLVSDEFDVVMLALPHYWLGQIEWDDPGLRKRFQEHVANYDFPAHYLRISCLFERPFWRDQVTGSYFMLDAFGGCCQTKAPATRTAPTEFWVGCWPGTTHSRCLISTISG